MRLLKSILAFMLVMTMPAYASEPIEELLPELIVALKKPNHMVKPRRLVGPMAEGMMQYARSNGPIYVTARKASKINGQCWMMVVSYEMRNTLTADGKRQTALVPAPVPVCQDGSIPKFRMGPDELAAINSVFEQMRGDFENYSTK